MIESFIEQVVQNVKEHYGSFNGLTFVLPSKRAGSFLKFAIERHSKETILCPKIYSIEHFIEELSGLSYLSQNHLLFHLYQTYVNTGNYEKESFDSFLTWAPTLLQDFNELDRYLVDAQALYDNLSAIQEIKHWSLDDSKTPLMTNYLAFWKNIYPIYNAFNAMLQAKGTGHQGLVYRKAYENLLLSTTKPTNHIFLGFNALNTAEEKIIDHILQNSDSHIYWDIDPYFLDDPIHDAGHFIRQHLKTWCPRNKAPNLTNTHYLSEKHIEIVGVPKNISQAKHVSKILYSIYEEQEDTKPLEDIALVLGDETLLAPILNAIPPKITAINITMGQPLHAMPVANYFTQFLELLALQTERGWYHKDLLQLLDHPTTQTIDQKYHPVVQNLRRYLAKHNIIYINWALLHRINDSQHPIINCLLNVDANSPSAVIDQCLNLILILKEQGSKQGNPLLLEQLYRLSTVLNNLKDMIGQYDFIQNINTLKILFKELLSSETLDFEGNPMEGLQIMGMLESRNLDFDTVILTSVNEGILPAGKSQNSFIPFDLKQRFGLPTYKEKDAVYTYHFYRLIQRAKNIYLLYNTEPDTLEGGEKSRLIRQLLTDDNRKDITEHIAFPQLQYKPRPLEVIKKSPQLLNLIQTKAQRGFSPSSLGSYIKNPITFYKRHLLYIEDMQMVEENIAANTFGTIIHDALEELYTPYVGDYLSTSSLHKMKNKIQEVVARQFEKTHSNSSIATGKNYISFHVILKYIEKFIDLEIQDLKHNKIKLLSLEQTLSIQLNDKSLPYPVTLKGKVDRVDAYNGQLRILDYKTGRVDRSNVEIIDWSTIIVEDRYNKAFQLLCYAYLFQQINHIPELLAGIISFKNLKEGVMLFGQKSSSHSKIKDHIINDKVLADFKTQLIALIGEICHPEIPITEKEE
jgi:hypothetical protein